MTALLAAMESRAEFLVPVLALGYVVGSFLAQGPFERTLAAAHRIARTLGQKLDRPHRSTPTLVYRGMLVVALLLTAVTVISVLLSQPIDWVQLLATSLLIAWFGRCFATLPSIALWRRAKAETLGLELKGLPYLFADTHAVIRYIIAERLDTFAIGVVGSSFWYVIGGLPAMAIYLSLSAMAPLYPTPAFGWAACSAFRVAHAIPAFINRTLIFLGALFTPHTKPLAGLRASGWRAAVAQTLDIALGGPMPGGELPWVGTGTARLTHQHLRRALLLILASTLLLILLLATS